MEVKRANKKGKPTDEKGNRSTRVALLKDPDWAALLLLRSEFRNVLGFYLRQKN